MTRLQAGRVGRLFVAGAMASAGLAGCAGDPVFRTGGGSLVDPPYGLGQWTVLSCPDEPGICKIDLGFAAPSAGGPSDDCKVQVVNAQHQEVYVIEFKPETSGAPKAVQWILPNGGQAGNDRFTFGGQGRPGIEIPYPEVSDGPSSPTAITKLFNGRMTKTYLFKINLQYAVGSGHPTPCRTKDPMIVNRG